jgi:hypothetical protein
MTEAAKEPNADRERIYEKLKKDGGLIFQAIEKGLGGKPTLYQVAAFGVTSLQIALKDAPPIIQKAIALLVNFMIDAELQHEEEAKAPLIETLTSPVPNALLSQSQQRKDSSPILKADGTNFRRPGNHHK